MSKGRALTRLAALGAAIAGVVFFWRKRQGATSSDATPTAADRPSESS
jgi:hypothetical protein